MKKGDKEQVGRGLRENSREEKHACDSDRLKGMGKKEPSLERLRQEIAALEQALLQYWKETPKLLVLPFFCYQLQSVKHTGQTSSFQQYKLLEDTTTCYHFLSVLAAGVWTGEQKTPPVLANMDRGCSRVPSACSVCFFPFWLRNTDAQNGLKEHFFRP